MVERAYFHDGFILGDLNEDGNIDVLDVVGLVNQILDGGMNPMGDMNGDGENNILDVVILAGIILS